MPHRETVSVDKLDFGDMLEEIAEISTAATCARLALYGVMELEAAAEPFRPVFNFLLRLESDIGTLKANAEGLRRIAA